MLIYANGHAYTSIAHTYERPCAHGYPNAGAPHLDSLTHGYTHAGASADIHAHPRTPDYGVLRIRPRRERTDCERRW